MVHNNQAQTMGDTMAQADYAMMMTMIMMTIRRLDGNNVKILNILYKIKRQSNKIHCNTMPHNTQVLTDYNIKDLNNIGVDAYGRVLSMNSTKLKTPVQKPKLRPTLLTLLHTTTTVSKSQNIPQQKP